MYVTLSEHSVCQQTSPWKPMYVALSEYSVFAVLECPVVGISYNATLWICGVLIANATCQEVLP